MCVPMCVLRACVYMCVACVCVRVCVVRVGFCVSTYAQETGLLYKSISITTQGHVCTAVTNHCHFFTLKRQKHMKVTRHSRFL